MASELLVYLRLGFEHIADPKGVDHILFIVALCAGYRPKQWREILVLVTAFTVGHSLTLALATLRIVSMDAALIEFLIAATIFVTSVINIVEADRETGGFVENSRIRRMKYGLALGFGFIHGLGFSTFLRAVLGAEESITMPLLAFNIGLEVGQIAILVVILGVSAAIVRWTRLRRYDWILVLSGLTAGPALLMMMERIAL